MVRAVDAEILGWDMEEVAFGFREGFCARMASCSAKYAGKILSAAARVGSSRFTAGVPDFDLDRLVDFPNDPVSGTCLRDLDAKGLSILSEKLGNRSSMVAIFAYPCMPYGLRTPSLPINSSSSGTPCIGNGGIFLKSVGIRLWNARFSGTYNVLFSVSRYAQF